MRRLAHQGVWRCRRCASASDDASARMQRLTPPCLAWPTESARPWLPPSEALCDAWPCPPKGQGPGLTPPTVRQSPNSEGPYDLRDVPSISERDVHHSRAFAREVTGRPQGVWRCRRCASAFRGASARMQRLTPLSRARPWLSPSEALGDAWPSQLHGEGPGCRPLVHCAALGLANRKGKALAAAQ